MNKPGMNLSTLKKNLLKKRHQNPHSMKNLYYVDHFMKISSQSQELELKRTKDRKETKSLKHKLKESG